MGLNFTAISLLRDSGPETNLAPLQRWACIYCSFPLSCKAKGYPALSATTGFGRGPAAKGTGNCAPAEPQGAVLGEEHPLLGSRHGKAVTPCWPPLLGFFSLLSLSRNKEAACCIYPSWGGWVKAGGYGCCSSLDRWMHQCMGQGKVSITCL